AEVLLGHVVLLHRHLEALLEEPDDLHHAERVDHALGEQRVVIRVLQVRAHVEEVLLDEAAQSLRDRRVGHGHWVRRCWGRSGLSPTSTSPPSSGNGATACGAAMNCWCQSWPDITATRAWLSRAVVARPLV